MMDCTINNCTIHARVKKHNQTWYKVYAFQYSEALYTEEEKESALVAKFTHEGDAYRYANIVQANPGNTVLIIIR